MNGLTTEDVKDQKAKLLLCYVAGTIWSERTGHIVAVKC